MIFMIFDTEEEKSKFIRLYDKYRKFVFYTVKRFISNEADIEDYLQDIYLIVGENLNRIDENDERRTRNYVITLTRNYCISRWRKNKNVKEEEFSDTVDYQDERFDPVNIVINIEAYELLVKALDKLDDKYRAALELKYINDLSNENIAKILNINKKNVQMRIYRARLMVRKYMEELSSGEIGS